MNKSGFIKEISEKLGYDEVKCNIINDIIEEHFIIGKNNKEKILNDLIEKLGVNQEEADNIYNAVMEIIGKQIKDKILHPFRKKD